MKLVANGGLDRTDDGQAPMQDPTRLSEAVRQAADPLRLTQRVADQALNLVQGADGVFIALWDGGDFLSYVCGAGFLKPAVGLKLSISRSMSGLALRTGQLLRSDDTRLDERVDRESSRRLGVLSTICIPLIREHKSFGVMCVSSRQTNAFDAADELILSGLADFVSVVVSAAIDLERVTSALMTEWTVDSSSDQSFGPLDSDLDASRHFVANVLSPDAADQLAARDRIERAIQSEALTLMFQPVIDLSDRHCFGYEALARFPEEPIRPPNEWFAEAHEVGLGEALELHAVELALAALARLPEDALLAINVGPRAIVSSRLAELITASNPRRLIFELTEHVEISDYPSLIGAVATLRDAGARLAIDDTGAGISSLAHILKLAPDVIKLDRTLTSGIDHDPVRRALATSLIRFSDDIGAHIVAEGIETNDELHVLQDLGICYGQGFLLGRPTALSDLSQGSKQK